MATPEALVHKAKAQVDDSARAIARALGTRKMPSTLVILGSGFKGFSALLTDVATVDLADVPHMPVPKVEGHGNALLIGSVGGQDVAVLTGRVHLYEGYTADEVVFPLRVLAQLGVKRVLLTNASGAVSLDHQPGEVLLVRDQLNLTGDSCLFGVAGRAFGPLFVDMGQAFDADWAAALKQAEPHLKDGVYAGVHGPAYETPAEARMLSILGAQVVGMSTVQEVIAARQLGVKVLCLSFITNWSGGMGTALHHADVLALVEVNQAALQSLLVKAIQL